MKMFGSHVSLALSGNVTSDKGEEKAEIYLPRSDRRQSGPRRPGKKRKIPFPPPAALFGSSVIPKLTQNKLPAYRLHKQSAKPSSRSVVTTNCSGRTSVP